jgi:hypothetical protein
MFTLLTGRLVHEAETVNELLLAAWVEGGLRLKRARASPSSYRT